MVWGEVAPPRSRFRVVEWAAWLGLVALGGYLLSDPIGRAAAKSYESATQSFIELRESNTNFVSRDNINVKDLATFAVPTLSATDANFKPADFSKYGSLTQPSMTIETFEVSLPEVALPNRTQTASPQTKPLAIEEMTGDMGRLLDNSGTTLLIEQDCSSSSELTGLCGAADVKTIFESE